MYEEKNSWSKVGEEKQYFPLVAISVKSSHSPKKHLNLNHSSVQTGMLLVSTLHHFQKFGQGGGG